MAFETIIFKASISVLRTISVFFPFLGTFTSFPAHIITPENPKKPGVQPQVGIMNLQT